MPKIEQNLKKMSLKSEILGSMWRRERDSNPRARERKLISSPFGNLEVIEQYYPKLAIFQ